MTMSSKLLGLIILIAVTTGCVTKQVKMPLDQEASSRSMQSGIVIGVSTSDARATETLGRIGLAIPSVGSELENYIQSTAKSLLKRRGYAAVDAPDIASPSGVTLSHAFNGKIVSIAIESATLNTFDALLAPAKTTINLNTRVYSDNGNVLHEQRCQGNGSGHIGLSVSGESEGKALASAVRVALGECLNNSEFRKAIK